MPKVWRFDGDVTNMNIDGGFENKLDPSKKTVKLSELPQVDTPDSETLPAGLKSNKVVDEKPIKKRSGVPGRIDIRGFTDSTSNIVNASDSTVEGTGKVVQDKLDSITLNALDEAQKLEITRKDYSRLHKDIKYVEDADGLRDFLGYMAQDGHFATSDFLLEEYAKANDLTAGSPEVQRFANLLIGSRNVNVEALKAKLEQRESLNPFQLVLKQTISNLAK